MGRETWLEDVLRGGVRGGGDMAADCLAKLRAPPRVDATFA